MRFLTIMDIDNKQKQVVFKKKMERHNDNSKIINCDVGYLIAF